MSSTNASTIAAVAAAVREAEQASVAQSVPAGGRRSVLGKAGVAGPRLAESVAEERPNANGYPSPPSSLPKGSGFVMPGKIIVASGSAVVDGPSGLSVSLANSKARVRRASEGSALSGDKRSGAELKCETCGKSYKHGSCLSKHL
jgi:hypothetical protein